MYRLVVTVHNKLICAVQKTLLVLLIYSTIVFTFIGVLHLIPVKLTNKRLTKSKQKCSFD